MRTSPPSLGVIRFALLAILALSAWIQFTVVNRTEVNKPLRADASVYFTSAYNLRNFGTYSSSVTWTGATSDVKPVPDSLVTPGYPLFLLAVGNPQPDIAYLTRVMNAQAGLGVLSVLLMFLISRRFLHAWLAIGAALLTALSPHLAVMSTYMLTESLFFFLLLASIYATQIAVGSGKQVAFLLAGLLWGWCSLVRPTVQFIPPLLLLGSIAVPALRQFARPALICLIGFLAIQAPWQLRNMSLPLADSKPSLMVNFLNFGSYPNFMYEGRPESYGFPYSHDPNLAQAQKDLPSVLNSIATKFRHEPAKYVRWYLLGKPGFFLSWTNIDGVADVFVYPVVHSPYFEDRRFALIRTLMYVIHWPLMLMGLLGVLLACVRPRMAFADSTHDLAVGVVILVFVYGLVFHMVGAPLPRYGIPFRPLLFPMALLLLQTMWVRNRSSK